MALLRMSQLTPEYFEKRRLEALAKFPTALYGEPGSLPIDALDEFEESLLGGEEFIQKYFEKYPYALQYAIQYSGHYGTWLFSKTMVKMPSLDGKPGLIPDFLAVTRSSLGYFWHIVELKRSDYSFSNRQGTAISREANKAIVQCNSYISHMQQYIDAVRSGIRVHELIQPEGAILIMGDSANESVSQTNIRSEFSRTHGKIQVATYDRIRTGLKNDLGRRVASQ